MAIIIQYFKTSTKSGHNTLIPHILNVFCQDFVKTVAFITHLFIKNDCLFTTEDIFLVL